jgi:hypothetical protein
LTTAGVTVDYSRSCLETGLGLVSVVRLTTFRFFVRGLDVLEFFVPTVGCIRMSASKIFDD